MRFKLPCGGLRGCGVVLALVPRDGGAHLLLGDEELHAVRLAQVRVERAHLVASPVAVCRAKIQCRFVLTPRLEILELVGLSTGLPIRL